MNDSLQDVGLAGFLGGHTEHALEAVYLVINQHAQGLKATRFPTLLEHMCIQIDIVLHDLARTNLGENVVEKSTRELERVILGHRIFASRLDERS